LSPHHRATGRCGAPSSSSRGVAQSVRRLSAVRPLRRAEAPDACSPPDEGRHTRLGATRLPRSGKARAWGRPTPRSGGELGQHQPCMRPIGTIASASPRAAAASTSRYGMPSGCLAGPSPRCPMGGTACAAVTTGDLGSPRRGCPSGHFQGSSRSASGAVREEEPTPRDQTQPPAEPLRKVRRLRDEMLGDEERRLSATEIAALAGDPSSTSPAAMPRRPRDLGTRMDVRRLVSAEIYPEWAGENSGATIAQRSQTTRPKPSFLRLRLSRRSDRAWSRTPRTCASLRGMSMYGSAMSRWCRSASAYPPTARQRGSVGPDGASHPASA
jgi:hypothetical protein